MRYAKYVNKPWLWNWGISFRFHQQNLCKTAPRNHMTSYPVGNKTSSSQKPCIQDKTLLWNAIWRSWSIFQNPPCKIAWSAPAIEITLTSYPACNKTSLSRKPCIPVKKLLWNTIRKSYSCSFRMRHVKSPEAPHGGEITMTSFPAYNKTSLSRKPCITDK